MNTRDTIQNNLNIICAMTRLQISHRVVGRIWVIFVHREEYYDPSEENKGQAEIIIAKQRNGRLGIVKLKWLGEYARFVDSGYRNYS